MSHRSQVWMKGLGIFSAFVMIGSTCFSSPTLAHVINEEVLTVPLEQQTHVENLKCSLLVKGGQTIFIQKDFSEMTIPITVTSNEVLEETEEGTKVTVTVESKNEERLQASLDVSEFELKEETKTINLTLRMVEPVEEESEPVVSEQEQSEPVISEPEVPESEIQVQEPLMVGTSGQEQPEEGTQEEPEDPNGTVNPEKTPEDTGSETPETPETPEDTTPGGNVTPPEEEETPTEPEKDPETEKPKEDQETEKEEEESPLEAKVELKSGESTYSAKFVVVEELDPEESLGELSYCPKQYHPNGIIELVNNQEKATILGEFPALTSYELSGKKYLLYDGGKIKLSAGEKIKLDILNTGSKQELVFASAGGTEHKITYAEAPDKSDNSQLLIMNKDEVTLPVNYQWGELAPVVVIEQLTMGENGLEWNAVETITHNHEDGGKIKLIPNNPEAGTYRVIISWMEGEITLYKMEKPFYVQHKNADYGGNG